MIKRVIGVVFTLLTIATIVFAALEWGNYSSMVFDFELRKLFGATAEATTTETEHTETDEATEAEEELIDGALMIDGAVMINGEGM